jgi:starvation-inducible DNA-binding protein
MVSLLRLRRNLMGTNRRSDFFREVSAPDSLSSLSNGTPTSKDTNPDGEGGASSLPNGDSARNIGRPSPDSPNLKYRDLDRKRPPAEKQDFGYVHDSGSGSARVIPYDSGFANNSSALRNASKNVPVDETLWGEIQALAKGESSKPISRGGVSINPVNGGKGFETFPSAYANGWALAQYKRLGGKWKKEGRENLEDLSSRVAERYSAKRDDPKMKNTGKGGLGTWFAGHGGGAPDDRARWGDWIAITPVKHTITKEDGDKKTYEPGDIVGPCAVSSEPEWKDVTSGGKKPLKCMPREKAWEMSKEDRASLAKKKRREEAKHRGKKPVNTPTFSDEAKEVTKASIERVASLYLEARSQPAQDLGGVNTWVTKTRQDQIQNDTSAPEKGRGDSEDGKPQRDRVLPLPDGHPEGRDEQRVGPGVMNSPPDSSGQGGANRKPKDPSALSDHPSGKPLHQRPRSSGLPGDQYGHPYIDQSQSTGLKRRVDASMMRQMEMPLVPVEDEIWDIDEEGALVRVAKLSIRPPRKRQRKQRGQQARKYKTWKRRNRTKYRAMLRKKKREYRSNKNNIKTRKKRRQKRVRRAPHLFKRHQGGGISTTKQKTRRDEATRRRNKKAHTMKVQISALLRAFNQVHQKRASTGYALPFDLEFTFLGIRGYLLSLSEMMFAVNIYLEGETSMLVDLDEFMENVEWDSQEDEEMFMGLLEDSYAFDQDDSYNDFSDLELAKEEAPAKVKLASSGSTSLSAMSLLLACLRGAHWSHWNSHWQVKGSNFYGNHLLLERVYESLIDQIDTLAEKIICLYGSDAINPVDQAQLMANKLLPLAEAESMGDPLKRALVVESALQAIFKAIYDLLKEEGSLTLGLDDFIMSMANEHETNLYLLRQAHRG